MKPILFIDVDGVLFGVYDDLLQLRPGVNGFLKWCTDNFECAWLSCWGISAQNIGRWTYGGAFFNKIEECFWDRTTGNKADGAILYADGRKFFWIEDPILSREKETLDEHGLLDSYIEVDYFGRDELERVRAVLEEKLKWLTWQEESA